MNKHDRVAWMKKSESLNEGYQIKVGDTVKHCLGYEGKIVKITLPESGHGDISDHGCIEIELKDSTIEHFVYFQWQSNFRIMSL